MGFFSDIEEPGDAFRGPDPRRVRWRGDADDTMGVPVPLGPLLIRNEQVAVIATGFFAYPSGFRFSLLSISRLDPSPVPIGLHRPGMRDRGDTTDGELRFGIGFADGTKVVGRLPLFHSDGSPRILRSMGGGGGGRKWSQGFWCQPLPSPGPMTLVIEWRDVGVAETTMEIDGSLILDAGSRAVPLWPDDVDLPEETGQHSSGPATSWYSGTTKEPPS